MAAISSRELRSKLQTDFAKAAFDQVNALGPEWTYIADVNNEVYAAPSIETKEINGAVSTAVGGILARSLDDAIVQTRDKLVAKASKDGTLVVVNQNDEFLYNKKTESFTKLKALQTKAPQGRFSCTRY